MWSRAHLLCLVFSIVSATAVTAQRSSAPGPPANPQDMSEKALIDRIKRFEKMIGILDGSARQAGVRDMLWETAITHIDALLERFENSPFAEAATITKLKALAVLARGDGGRLEQLLELTDEVSRNEPGRQLAAENAFYAIQGFVVGARAEGMSNRRRLDGTVERYDAFLADHPTSERVPVIRASLVRNLIALDLVGRARRELSVLQRDHAGHRATSRARGELFRVDAIGKPFAFDHTTSDGARIRSEDHLGKVLVVHFWATWSDASRDALPKLVELYRKHKSNDLQLIGVNIDKSRKQIGEALGVFDISWPQYFDEKGLENDAFVSMGVLSVPIYFVIDRRGILRRIAGIDDLPQLIENLLAEPAKKE